MSTDVISAPSRARSYACLVGGACLIALALGVFGLSFAGGGLTALEAMIPALLGVAGVGLTVVGAQRRASARRARACDHGAR